MPKSKAALIRQACINDLLRRLALTPMSAHEAETYLGVSLRCTRDYLKALKDDGLIYVSSWTRSKKHDQLVMVFSAGSQPDAPRPAPRTGHDRYMHRKATNPHLAEEKRLYDREWFAKVKADPERIAHRRKKQKQWYRRTKAKDPEFLLNKMLWKRKQELLAKPAARDPLVAALFGGPK